MRERTSIKEIKTPLVKIPNSLCVCHLLILTKYNSNVPVILYSVRIKIKTDK